jgi:uncharacterized protein (TIGR02145 family)
LIIKSQEYILSNIATMKRFLKIPVIIFLSSCLMAITQSCKKNPVIPTLTTVTVSGITQTSSTSGGNITDDGGAGVTARGVCWGTAQNPSTGTNETEAGTGTGAFTSNITGLTANTTYHVRAYATNSVGTAYGNDVSFSTNPVNLATVTTNSITWITLVSAAVEGTISDDGGATITEEGFCWDINHNPTTASNTTYYVRAYAINSAGTAYGNEVSFATRPLEGISFNPDLTYGSVSDIEGNVYKTITIGTQTWMAENLRATKYSNGDLIETTIPDSLNINEEYDPKYQWAYEGNESLVAVFGRLYTWYAATDSRNICPVGWHVPAFTEWTTLADFLGGESVAGGKLKESGFTHWTEWSIPIPATNETGFTALPGGTRHNDGVFYIIDYSGYWWSSTQTDTGSGAWGRDLNFGDNNLYATGEYAKEGWSVRCVQD